MTCAVKARELLGVHGGAVHAAVSSASKAAASSPRSRANRDELRAPQPRLALEQAVMHLPELAARRGPASAASARGLGVGEQVTARVGAEHEADVGRPRQQVLTTAWAALAARAGEVSVLDDW